MQGDALEGDQKGGELQGLPTSGERPRVQNSWESARETQHALTEQTAEEREHQPGLRLSSVSLRLMFVPKA